MPVSEILTRIFLFIFVIIADLVFLIGVGMGFDAGVSFFAIAFTFFYFSLAIPLLFLCWLPKETLFKPSRKLKAYYYYLASIVFLIYAGTYI